MNPIKCIVTASFKCSTKLSFRTTSFGGSIVNVEGCQCLTYNDSWSAEVILSGPDG